ncbi:MAG: RAMP superfamily CRISPR-associated protein [Thermoproteota archaeon]
MKVYKLELEVETPLVITEDQTTNILRHSASYISGSAIRGSLLTYLHNEKKKNIEQEINDPKLVFHPAYLLIGEDVTRPAHPLVFSCKLCAEDSIFTELSKEVIISREIDKAIPTKCPKGHLFSTKSKGGELIIERKENGKKTFKSVELDNYFTSIESIGINRKLGSVEVGMIYSYIALSPRTKFTSLIFDQGERINELDVESEFTLYIGRGTSRGLGHVRAKLNEDSEFIDKEINRIKATIENLDRIVILRALSPVFHIEIKSDLNGNTYLWSNPTLAAQSIPSGLSKYHLIGDKNYLLTGMSKVSGFSTISNIPKVSLEGAKPGSLFFYKSSYDLDYEKLVNCELSGFGQFSYSGFNILEVYEL